MTAPIQEPSTDRALQGFAFARDQIQRRPALTATGGVNESAGFFGWTPDGTGLVSNTTWTDIGTIGSALATYVTLQNNTDYSVNFNTCQIDWTVSSVIYVMGQIRFANNLAAGVRVGVRLEFGGGVGATDVMNLHEVPGGSPGTSNYFFDVHAWTYGVGNVRLFVYQDSGVSQTFESADLSCMTVCFETETDTIFT